MPPKTKPKISPQEVKDQLRAKGITPPSEKGQTLSRGEKGLGGKPKSKASLTKAEKAGEGKMPSAKSTGQKMGKSIAERQHATKAIEKSASKVGSAVSKIARVARVAGPVGAVVGAVSLAKDAYDTVKSANARMDKVSSDLAASDKRSMAEFSAKLANSGSNRKSPSTRGKMPAKKAPAAPAVKTSSSFGEAFRAARNSAAKAGNADSGIFEYKGKKYNTKLKK